MPKSNQSEREIRADAIKNARIRKEAAALIRKYGIENLVKPAESEKDEIMSKDARNFFESMKIRRELKDYLKRVSVYARATKPYTDAVSLIAQAEYYTHYEELEEKYILNFTK